MVQAIQLNPGLLGGHGFSGLNGFLNGNALGDSDGQQPLASLFKRDKNGLRNSLGFDPFDLLTLNPLVNRLTKNPLDNSKKPEEEKPSGKKDDQVDLSNFVKDSAAKAVENAQRSPRAGDTNQVFVSQDGRFEVSIDLQVRSDGSYDLELQVGFAQSQAFGLSSTQSGGGAVAPASTEDAISSADQPVPASDYADPTAVAATNGEPVPATDKPLQYDQSQPDQSYQSLSAYLQRYTSFEQVLQTRDFEAHIFFEQSKTVALAAEQAYGSDSGDQVLNVAQNVASEFRLNISISGSDINNFNDVASQLTQFDDSGTLSGFLDAVNGVLTADPSKLGSFVNASQALFESARQHVSAKLDLFFTGFNEAFGATLEDLGFAPDYIANLGQDVQNDLNSFFDVTNNFLSNLVGGNNLLDPQQVDNSQLDVLTQNLQQLREDQQQALEEAKKPKPTLDRVDENDKSNQPESIAEAGKPVSTGKTQA